MLLSNQDRVSKLYIAASLFFHERATVRMQECFTADLERLEEFRLLRRDRSLQGTINKADWKEFLSMILLLWSYNQLSTDRTVMSSADQLDLVKIAL